MSVSLLVAALLVAPAEEASDSPPFFTVAERDGRWAILDPTGEPFLMRGLNHYGDGTLMPWNRAERFGEPADWRAALPGRLANWGFNYLPPSIGPTHRDPATVDGKASRANVISRAPEWGAADFAAVEFPFAIMLAYPMQYMSPPDLPDVFSEEFAAGLDARCREVCEPLADDPNLIGYHFAHNPPWHPRAKHFDAWIDAMTRPGSAGRRAWVDLMKRTYGTPERWRAVYGIPIKSWEEIEALDDPLDGYIDRTKHLRDREAFMRRACERWYSLHHAAIRRYDPHHLILGDRNTLHLQPLPGWAVEIMKPYVDVLCVNTMGAAAVQAGVLEAVTRVWDGPVLLADTGAHVYAGDPRKSGWPAADEAEYAAVYRSLAEFAAAHPQIVGWGWCGFYEIPHPGGRGGLVDVQTGEPIPERLDALREANADAAARYAQEFGTRFPPK